MNKNQDHFPALLTIKQAASFLGLNEQTLRNQQSRGTSPLPTIKVGARRMVRRIDVERLAYGDQHGPVAQPDSLEQ
ncbi:MAG: helix-turn-helix domain-containing protein [Halothiobacillus sp.]|jgi:hypothetical protein